MLKVSGKEAIRCTDFLQQMPERLVTDMSSYVKGTHVIVTSLEGGRVKEVIEKYNKEERPLMTLMWVDNWLDYIIFHNSISSSFRTALNEYSSNYGKGCVLTLKNDEYGSYEYLIEPLIKTKFTVVHFYRKQDSYYVGNNLCITVIMGEDERPVEIYETVGTHEHLLFSRIRDTNVYKVINKISPLTLGVLKFNGTFNTFAEHPLVKGVYQLFNLNHTCDLVKLIHSNQKAVE